MTERDTLVEVSDGDQLNSGYFNGILDLKLHRKQFSNATERTHTGDTDWTNSGTAFTLTAPVNALILGVYFTCKLKTSDGSYNTSCNIKITGSNFGTKYLTSAFMRSVTPEINYLSYLNTSENILFYSDAEGYQTFSTASFIPIKVLDTSTTFTIRIQIENASATAYVDDVTLDIMYLNAYTED